MKSSFKTQILSFNASIEAARAGQYGKGFSVVAGEIGKLAINSGIASDKIFQLIHEGEQKIEEVLWTTSANIDEASQIARDLESSFRNIQDKRGKLTQKTEALHKLLLKKIELMESSKNELENVRKIAEGNVALSNTNMQKSNSLDEQKTSISKLTIDSSKKFLGHS